MRTTTILLLATVLPGAATLARDYPIKPVPFTDVHIKDDFWRPRLETNRKVTLPYEFKKCEETGRIDNFSKAAHLMPGEFQGIFFNDSDVYKIIEGASYSLALEKDPRLDRYLDDLIAKIAAAQEPDGYLYTCRTINPAKAQPAAGPTRWSNEVDSHELYSAGHMYEAAVAHYQATGKKTLLSVAIKSADLIDRTFGPNGRHDVPGHEEIELALVKLFRVTGEERYLKLAKFFLDQRGHTQGRKTRKEYDQDHKPLIEQDEPVGHAVRAMYLYCGMTDVAAITGDPAYAAALDRIWNNLVSTKLYLTGGIGSTGSSEAFGQPYELPNATAYAETCAAIGNAMWNHRMFLLHGDAKYIDVLERSLYNGSLSGVSLSGDQFFYVNPLETDGIAKFNQGAAVRSPWFDCSCCPGSLVRFLPSIPGYVYATRDDVLYVNLFIASQSIVKVGGQRVGVRQETQYPAEGRVGIVFDPQQPGEFEVRVRIPGWSTNAPVPSDLYRFVDKQTRPVRLIVNGSLVDFKTDKGYAVLKRRWTLKDAIVLDLPMEARRVLAHEKVQADHNRVALQRGPLVYCFEGVDNNGHAVSLKLPDDANLSTRERDPNLLGGISRVYATVTPDESLWAVPYYAWNHRGPGEMAVWIRRDQPQ